MNNAVILFNPLAGRGKASLYAVRARKHLQQQGWKVEDIAATRYAGHAQHELAPQWCRKVSLIVLVGGDGTLRELVSGLRSAGSKTEIAFVPMGNANVVARELGIPLNPDKAIDLITHGQTRTIDACILKRENLPDMVFLAMLEIGFGAKIVYLVDKLRNGSLNRLYRLWGDLVYAIAGIIALKGLDRDTFKATIDGQEVDIQPSHGVIANMQTYAKGWSLTPDALPNDGVLDTAMCRRSDAWTVIRTFLAAAQKRKLNASIMRYQQASTVTISSEKPLFAQVDGDPVDLNGEAVIAIEKGVFVIRV